MIAIQGRSQSPEYTEAFSRGAMVPRDFVVAIQGMSLNKGALDRAYHYFGTEKFPSRVSHAACSKKIVSSFR